MLGTVLAAALLAVAGMTAGIAGHQRQAPGTGAVPNVVDERPRAVERRRSQVFRVPADDIAGGIADAATDAFDSRIDRAPLARLRRAERPRRRRALPPPQS